MEKKTQKIVHIILMLIVLAVMLTGTFSSYFNSGANAQELSLSLAGEWRGTFNINIGGDREIIFTLTEEGGALKAVFDSPTEAIMAVSAESVTITGNDIRIFIPRIQGEYFGTIHADRAPDGQPVRIDGDWSHAGEFMPITIHRTLTP